MSIIGFQVTQPQYDFHQLDCKYPAFIAGFGSGKTETLIQSAIKDKLLAPRYNVACYAPTYDLLKLIIAPRLIEALEELGIIHTYNKSDNTISCYKYGKFILRSLDNPARIVGYETFRAHVDELDTLRLQSAKDAWNKIIARNRSKVEGVQNKVSAYSTPEGFQFVYERWAKNPNEDYKYITAPTYSNPFLPEGYIEGLKATYPPQLIESYIEGKFVNLTTGSVYPNFDRFDNLDNDNVIEKPYEALHIGMDFNVNNMAAVVHVMRNGIAYAVNEFTNGRDTPSIVETIFEYYPVDKHSIIIYPDASGRATKSTNASQSDITILKNAGLTVSAPRSNGPIKDRIASFNKALRDPNGFRQYHVNLERCPVLALSLEQQCYDKNGMPDKSSGLDHILDASGYFAVRQFPIKAKPIHYPKQRWT